MGRIKNLFNGLFDLLLVLITLYLGFFVLVSPSGLRLYKQLSVLKSEEEHKLINMGSQIEDLQHKTTLLTQDKQYQEHEARVVWELVKPGEQIMWYHQMEDE